MSELTLHGADEATLALDHLSYEIVDQTVLVPDVLSFEIFSVGGFVDFLEDVLEASIVFLEDGVLRAHVERHLLEERKLEGGVRKPGDRIFGVILCLGDTWSLKVEYLDLFRFAAFGSVDKFESAWAWDKSVLGTVLVTECVTSDDNWFLPAWYETRDARDDDGFTEYCATAAKQFMSCGRMGMLRSVSLQDVPDGSVRRQPH